MKIKLFEAFAGYGSQRIALEKLGFEIAENSIISEIDKYAVETYTQIHKHCNNLGDITQIDDHDERLKDIDLFTYSFPCQDISVAGNQKGLTKDSGSRSSLLWECERIIRNNRPKYLLMENVKALISKKFMPDFQEWLNTLDDLGYDNYWQVLNAKDYGIPQNRERVFCVSIRKDIEHKDYIFPKKMDLPFALKDFLDDDVDENYHIIKEGVEEFLKTVDLDLLKPLEIDSNKQIIQLGNIVSTGNFSNPQRGRIYSSEGISPSLNTCGGGGLEPKILEISTKIRPGVYKNIEREIVDISTSNKEIYQCDCVEGFQDNKIGLKVIPTLRASNPSTIASTGKIIRKLTPNECWRLMGVSDDIFNSIKGISNSQLYKLAGNSIVVNVLVEIFRNLFTEE